MADIITLAEEFPQIAGSQGVLGDPLGEPAYFYARSSDKVQAREGAESLSRQLLFAHEKAKEDGRYIPLEMCYWDIWRGKDTERPQFHRLIMDVAKEKRSNLIYIDCTDRLSRNPAVYYVLLYDLTRYGLTIRFEKEEDELIRHIKLAFDELELEKRSYRQRAANRARATKGHVISKRPAFGYRLTDDHLSYEPKEPEAGWVKEIFHWIASGLSMYEVCGLLTKNEVENKKGVCWKHGTLKAILTNPVYKGEYIASRFEVSWEFKDGKQHYVKRERPKEEWIIVPVPPLVSEEIWQIAQERLAENKKKSLRNAGKHEWLLSGLVKCRCGASYTCQRKVHYQNGKTYVYLRYRCANHYRPYNTSPCFRPSITKKKLEGNVLAALDRIFLEPPLWEKILEDDDQADFYQEHVKFHQEKIEELDRQMGELLQLALTNRTETARRLFNQKQLELDRQRQSHEEQLLLAKARLEAAEDKAVRFTRAKETIEHVKNLGGLSNLPFDLKRRLLVLIVDEIVLDTKEGWFEIKGALGGKFDLRPDVETSETTAAAPSNVAHEN
jgi:site-specific DNA recombinase